VDYASEDHTVLSPSFETNEGGFSFPSEYGFLREVNAINGNHVAPKKRRRKRDGRDILLIVFAVIAVVAVLVAVWAIATRNRDAPPGNETQSTADTTESVEKLTDSIDLPGYGALNFKADVLEQDVTLPNP